jgi:pimeloyl-ACP methyl ester carboxylesterase
MWKEVVKLDMRQLTPKIEVPVIFMSGKNDMNNPTSLVEEYVAALKAPAGKEFILFENSAHSIFWDEPHELEKQVILVLRKLVEGNFKRAAIVEN